VTAFTTGRPIDGSAGSVPRAFDHDQRFESNGGIILRTSFSEGKVMIPLNCRRHTFLLSACLILLGFVFRPSLSAQDGYWVPAELPKSHYVIDARVDLSPKGAIEGKQTISLKNTSRRALDVVAFDWPMGPASSISVAAAGEALAPVNPEKKPALSSPLFFRLPRPLAPGKKLKLEVAFRRTVEFSDGDADFGDTGWYPRLWWDGLPVHDSFSVKLDIPSGFALAASGRLNPKTGRYENEGARTFGIYLGKGMKTETRESGGVLITTLATEKGA
jgi:hypothetical protein